MSTECRVVGYLRTESVAFSISTNTSAYQVWHVSDPGGTPVWTSETDDFNSAASGDYTVFPDPDATGDYAAWGYSATTFGGLVFDNGTGGTAGTGGVVAWEYWDGDSWELLTGLSDGTSGFTAATADGQTVTWTVPGDWASTTLNGVAAYYVRARITTVYTVHPVYDQGFIQIIKTVTLDDDDHFPDELAAEIQSKVIAAHAAFVNFTCVVSASTGIFTLSIDESAVITWDSTSTGLRDWMRLTGATTAVDDTVSGSRVHEVGFYPERTPITDLPAEDTASTQARTDNGQVDTVAYAQREERDLVFQFPGHHRSSSYGEYAALRDLAINHLQVGRRFRFYPDRTITNVYAEVSEPFGYHTLVAARPVDWNPAPLRAGWYGEFTFEVRALKYVSKS